MGHTTRELLESTVRAQHARMFGALVAAVGDLDLAEEALQDAYAEALLAWGQGSPPDNPAAWLVAVAKRRAVDRGRRDRARSRREEEAGSVDGVPVAPDPADLLEAGELPDERLRLLFLCCHPALASEAQVALTLRAVSGLSTEAIARAFLLPTETLAQRLVRAKRKIREAGIPFRLPAAERYPARLKALMSVVYLVFNEGYVASEGDQHLRSELCREALSLGQLLVELAPSEGEAHGLLALMLLLDARRAGRLDSDGIPLLLADQDRGLWDRARIADGVARIGVALSLGDLGPYGLQAAIAAAHAEARSATQTPWARIVALYDRLVAKAPTPVVRLNRVAAQAMAHGSEFGLAELDRLEAAVPVLGDYLWARTLRAELLLRLKRPQAARRAFDHALALATNAAQRSHLERRRAGLEGHA